MLLSRIVSQCKSPSLCLVGVLFAYVVPYSAKMEATENDLPPSVDFRITGFPTIKFKKAGSREFIDYDGDRSLESLIAFVEENAKNSLEPPPKVEAKNETHDAHEAQHILNEEPRHEEL